jgi:hypothetical protein
LKAVAVKQGFRSSFSKNERFKVMCEISCALEGEDPIVSARPQIPKCQ